jgi:hypothetical protein
MAIKYTKMAIKIPNGLEVHQNFSSQGLPKYTEIDILGLKNIPSGNPVSSTSLVGIIYLIFSLPNC